MKIQANYRESVAQAKIRNFGNRYVDANLGSLKWSKEKSEKLSGWLVNPKNMLILTGPAGVGKTYSCAAIIDWIHPNVERYRYHDEKKIFERLRSYIKNNGEYSAEIPFLIDDDFIILNDLGSAGFDAERYPWREEVWFSIIDELYNRMTPTVITTNLSKSQLSKKVHTRLVSRIFDKDNTIIDLSNEVDYRSENG